MYCVCGLPAPECVCGQEELSPDTGSSYINVKSSAVRAATIGLKKSQ